MTATQLSGSSTEQDIEVDVEVNGRNELHSVKKVHGSEKVMDVSYTTI